MNILHSLCNVLSHVWISLHEEDWIIITLTLPNERHWRIQREIMWVANTPSELQKSVMKQVKKKQEKRKEKKEKPISCKINFYICLIFMLIYYILLIAHINIQFSQNFHSTPSCLRTTPLPPPSWSVPYRSFEQNRFYR